jgi:hypothetical protein
MEFTPPEPSAYNPIRKDASAACCPSVISRAQVIPRLLSDWNNATAQADANFVFTHFSNGSNR